MSARRGGGGGPRRKRGLFGAPTPTRAPPLWAESNLACIHGRVYGRVMAEWPQHSVAKGNPSAYQVRAVERGLELA